MIWFALFTGCTDPSTSDDGTGPTASTAFSGDTGHPCGSPRMVLGHGTDTHVPLAKGDGVVLVHGPQNGWHVDLSAELWRPGEVMGFEGTITTVKGAVQIAGDQPAIYVGFEGVEGCSTQTAGLRLFVDDVTAPKGGYQAFVCSLADAALDIVLTGTDIDTKAEVSGEIRATAVLDEVDATYNCPSP